MKELKTENQYLNIDRTEINTLMAMYMQLNDEPLYWIIKEYSERRPRIRDFGRILLYYKDEIKIIYRKSIDITKLRKLSSWTPVELPKGFFGKARLPGDEEPSVRTKISLT